MERSSSGFRAEGKECKEGIFNEGTECCGSDCEAESEPHGTARWFRCIFAAVL
jgi:hypothetical protein